MSPGGLYPKLYIFNFYTAFMSEKDFVIISLLFPPSLPFPPNSKNRKKKRKIHVKFWRSIKTLLGFSGGERCLTIKETGIHWSIGFSLCTILASSISSASVTNLSFDIQVTFKNGRFSVPNLDCLRNQVTIMMTHDS